MNVTDEMVEAALDAMFGTPNGSLNSGLMAAIGYSGMYARADRAWCNVYDVAIESDGARIDNRADAMRAALTAALPSAADEPHSWMYRSEDPYDAGEWMWSDTKPDRREIFPLFTRPASARPSAGVGEE